MRGGSDGKGAASSGKPRLWTPYFILIICLSFSSSVVAQGLNTGITVYVELVGGTSFFAGFLAAVFSVAAAVTRLVAGRVVDSRGRAQVLRVGMALIAVGALLPVLFFGEVGLFAGRVLQGVGFAASSTAAATAAADVLPESRLGEGIGYYGLGHALSTSVGPALGLALVAMDPAESLFFILAGVGACVLALTALCRYEQHPEALPETSEYRRKVQAAQETCTLRAEKERDAAAKEPGGLFEPKALPGAIPMAALSAAFGFNVFFAGAYGTSLGLESAGGFFTCSAIAMIVVRLKSGSFMDSALPIKMFAVSIAAAVICFLLLLASPVCPMAFFAAGICYGVSNGIAMPLNQSIAVKNTPPERWGAANALFMLTFDVGIGLACLVWGAVNDALGYGASIVASLVCSLVAYALAWVVYPQDAKAPRRLAR